MISIRIGTSRQHYQVMSVDHLTTIGREAHSTEWVSSIVKLLALYFKAIIQSRLLMKYFSPMNCFRTDNVIKETYMLSMFDLMFY